jgi:capsular exopolysaccharide synthesis family protein
MTDPQSKTIALSSQKHRRREDATLDLVTVYDPTSAASDAYRMLRTNLFYALIDSPPNTSGLVDILAGGSRMEEVWREPIPGLKLICAGPSLPNPAELLSSRRLAEFLAEMRPRFDYVLVDAPPVGVSDSVVLAATGDGVLLVLDSQRTRKGPLRQALRSLQGVGANVLGTVMNNFEVSRGATSPYSNL